LKFIRRQIYSVRRVNNFRVQSSLSNTDAGLGGGFAFGIISVGPVADTPSVTNADAVNTQTTSGLVITRNRQMTGSLCTRSRTLPTASCSRMTARQIFNNQFVSVTQGNAGLSSRRDRSATSVPGTSCGEQCSAGAGHRHHHSGLRPDGGLNDDGVWVSAFDHQFCLAGSAITPAGIKHSHLTSDGLVLDKTTFEGPGTNLPIIQRSATAGTPLFGLFNL
jgi:hypothetical protein